MHPFITKKKAPQYGLAGIASIIAGMNPENAVVFTQHEYEKLRDNANYHFEGSFGAAVVADLTKLHLVIYNLNSVMNDKNNPDKHSVDLATAQSQTPDITIVDARGDDINIEMVAWKDYIPGIDPAKKTIHILGDGEHFMYIRPVTRQSEAPGLTGTSESAGTTADVRTSAPTIEAPSERARNKRKRIHREL